MRSVDTTRTLCSGNIGHCYALMFAIHGHQVAIHDAETKRAQAAKAEAERKLHMLRVGLSSRVMLIPVILTGALPFAVKR